MADDLINSDFADFTVLQPRLREHVILLANACDDMLDVMLTLASNTPIVAGLAPDRGRIRKDFPYYGALYMSEEQVGVTPMPRPAKK